MPHSRQEWEEALNGLLNYTDKANYIARIRIWAKEEGFDKERAHVYIIESLKILTGSIISNNQPTNILLVKPKEKVITIPGTLGGEFDEWISNGWDCSNMIEENYPNGQKLGLEVIRGYDEIGADSSDFRNQTLETLSPQRTKYYGMLRKRYQRWLMYRR
jgi:hypothetical protein